MELVIKNKHFNINPDAYSIETILVFGSFIRGDYNKKSDIDFLIIIDDCSLDEKANHYIDICSEMQIPLHWLSLFTISEFINLCAKGSHFVWSLYFEGKIFYSKNSFIENCFNNLPIYLNMRSDIMEHQKRLKTLKKDLLKPDRDYGKEICLLGYIVRNTLMILTYTYGYICFSKFDVFDICSKIKGLNLPFSRNEYLTLINLKEDYKYSPQEFVMPYNIDSYIYTWIKKIDLLLKISFIKITKIVDEGFISPFLFPALCQNKKEP